jgi:Domain of unknown function (DUF4326)
MLIQLGFMAIQPQIVHFRKHPYDIYIGRPSKWGNLYSSKAGLAKYKVATKAEAINKHREWVLSQPEFIKMIKLELRGKILGCWCDNPNACHGLILWQIANDINYNPENSIEHPTLF